MKKRLLSMACVVPLCLTMLPATALAEDLDNPPILSEENSPQTNENAALSAENALAGDESVEISEETPAVSDDWKNNADVAWFTGSETQYILSTPEELAGLAQLVNQGESFHGKTILLGADMDLGNREWTPIGGGGSGKQFQGTFDGDGHTISNLKITRGLSYTDKNISIGFFGATQGGVVKNFTLHNMDVTGSGRVAAVVGGDANVESKITNVHVTGSIQISGYWYVGAILGNGYTSISDCSVVGDGAETSFVSITGGYAGGIVGFMGEGNCVTSGCTVRDLTVQGAHNGIGGVSGILHYGNTIQDCTAENVVVWQTVTPEEDGRIYAGAFAGTFLDNGGKTPPTLENCEFTGEIYSGPDRQDILEAERYVGSLWYGAHPPATVNIAGCTIHMPAVAQVNGQSYSDLSRAAEAAKPGDTISLLRDITSSTWSTIRNLSGITLEGNGHVLTLNTQVFQSNGGNTFRNFTLDLTGSADGYGIGAASGDVFQNVSLLSGKDLSYGILISGTDNDHETVTVDNCTFDGMSHAIYDDKEGKLESLIVTNSTLKGGACLILCAPQGQFTGNTLDGTKLSIAGNDQTVTGNTLRNGSSISFYQDGSIFTGNHILSGSYLEFVQDNDQNWDLRDNDFGEEIILTTEVETVSVILPTLEKTGYTFAGWREGETTFQGGVPCSLTQSMTLTAQWEKTSSAGSGGDSSSGTSGSDHETETTVHPDGSITTIVTQGNKTQTVTKPDGSSQTTVSNQNGASSVVTTDKTGQVDAQVTLPSTVVEDAAQMGEAVALPMPGVSATNDRENAPTVSVILPSGTSAKVEIPVSNVTPGTVAIIIKEDGTEEIVKNSIPTQTGVTITLENGETVKIVDNSKRFEDVEDSYWGSAYIDFTSSREIFSGTSQTTFTPEQPMTRAMLVTVLAAYDGADISVSSGSWYEAGQQWAVEKGISDGSDMEKILTREQLAVMLWNYAGKPASSGDVSAYADGSDTSAWATQAMAWAVEQELISGMGNGSLAPQGSATRVQVAAILYHFISRMGRLIPFKPHTI